MRVFFCLELESALKHQIYRDFSHLRRSAAKVGWVRPENLHVTLKFLGEIDADQIAHLRELSEHVVSSCGIHTSIDTRMNSAGFFPNPKNPRVVWIGPADQPKEIVTLTTELNSRLEELGFEREQKSFMTHVTLGRVKEQSKSVEELVQLIEKTPRFEYEATFHHLTLMESGLTPNGSVYRPVFRIPFDEH